MGLFKTSPEKKELKLLEKETKQREKELQEAKKEVATLGLAEDRLAKEAGGLEATQVKSAREEAKVQEHLAKIEREASDAHARTAALSQKLESNHKQQADIGAKTQEARNKVAQLQAEIEGTQAQREAILAQKAQGGGVGVMPMGLGGKNTNTGRVTQMDASNGADARTLTSNTTNSANSANPMDTAHLGQTGAVHNVGTSPMTGTNMSPQGNYVPGWEDQSGQVPPAHQTMTQQSVVSQPPQGAYPVQQPGMHHQQPLQQAPINTAYGHM